MTVLMEDLIDICCGCCFVFLSFLIGFSTTTVNDYLTEIISALDVYLWNVHKYLRIICIRLSFIHSFIHTYKYTERSRLFLYCLLMLSTSFVPQLYRKWTWLQMHLGARFSFCFCFCLIVPPTNLTSIIVGLFFFVFLGEKEEKCSNICDIVNAAWEEKLINWNYSLDQIDWFHSTWTSFLFDCSAYDQSYHLFVKKNSSRRATYVR